MSAGTTVCFDLLLGFGVAAALWIGNDSLSVLCVWVLSDFRRPLFLKALSTFRYFWQGGRTSPNSQTWQYAQSLQNQKPM